MKLKDIAIETISEEKEKPSHRPALFSDNDGYGSSLVDSKGKFIDIMEDFLSDKTDKKHLYHTTKLRNLKSIISKGIIINKVGLKNGRQLNASFWSDDPTVRTAWTSEKDVVFRVKKNNRFKRSFQSGEGGEYLSETNVLPKDIEYLGADGEWYPLFKAG